MTRNFISGHPANSNCRASTFYARPINNLSKQRYSTPGKKYGCAGNLLSLAPVAGQCQWHSMQAHRNSEVMQQLSEHRALRRPADQRVASSVEVRVVTPVFAATRFCTICA